MTTLPNENIRSESRVHRPCAETPVDLRDFAYRSYRTLSNNRFPQVSARLPWRFGEDREFVAKSPNLNSIRSADKSVAKTLQ